MFELVKTSSLVILSVRRTYCFWRFKTPRCNCKQADKLEINCKIKMTLSSVCPPSWNALPCRSHSVFESLRFRPSTRQRTFLGENFLIKRNCCFPAMTSKPTSDPDSFLPAMASKTSNFGIIRTLKAKIDTPYCAAGCQPVISKHPEISSYAFLFAILSFLIS